MLDDSETQPILTIQNSNTAVLNIYGITLRHGGQIQLCSILVSKA